MYLYEKHVQLSSNKYALLLLFIYTYDSRIATGSRDHAVDDCERQVS